MAGGVLLATLVLLIAALILRRRWARKKAMSSVNKIELPGHSGVLGVGTPDDDHTGSLSIRGRGDIIWSRGWHTAASSGGGDSAKQAEMEAQTALLPQYADTGVVTARCGVPPPEYAELLNHHNQVTNPNSSGYRNQIKTEPCYD